MALLFIRSLRAGARQHDAAVVYGLRSVIPLAGERSASSACFTDKRRTFVIFLGQLICRYATGGRGFFARVRDIFLTGKRNVAKLQGELLVTDMGGDPCNVYETIFNYFLTANRL